jgi:homospermidine synthase
MTKHTVHVDFPGRFVFIGFGSIGQGVLPLIMRHIGTSAERITVVAPDERGIHVMRHFGVRFIQKTITQLNLRETLEPLVSQGDFVVNVSVDVSSVDLIKFCRERGALYLDTCIEPWPGGYTDTSIPAARRTNYALRETALALRDGAKDAPTAVLTHGANPGLAHARTGRGSRTPSASRSSTSPSATPRSRRCASSRASSSTPGPWTVS